MKNQVLVLGKNDSFNLAIVTEDQPASCKHIPATLLKPVGNSQLNYKLSKPKKVLPREVLSQLSPKRKGPNYIISNEELDKIQQLVARDDSPPLEATKRKNPVNKTQAPSSKKSRQSIIYQKGVKNSSVSITNYYSLLEDPSDSPQFDISTRVNNLNFFRAIEKKNKRLLRNLFKSDHKLSNILQPWGPEDSMNCLEKAILSENEEMVKALAEELKDSKMKKTFVPRSALGYVDTGNVSIEAYGVRTRKVQMSRGGREGNNALITEPMTQDSPNILTSIGFIKNLVKHQITPRMITLLISLFPLCENMFGLSIGEAVRTGNLKLSKFMISHFNKNSGYGLNFLHQEVLEPGDLTPFKKPSITKKPIENYFVAPLHVACINPDVKHLSTLLQDLDDLGYADSEGRKMVHYAAVCSSDAPLKFLAEKSINLSEFDKFKITPLMLAVSYNCVKTTRFLLEKSVPINIKSKSGKFPIHFAAENGSLETLALLMESGANIDQPGPDRKTALMLACTFGHYSCVKLLLESGAKVIKKDKCKRTALIFAVKNGHLKETSLLLAKGSPFNDPDSSKNYPIHYAAAFGWKECLNLLIQAGADINVYNDWKIQPILVAMLKGQVGIVQILLEQEGIDVNGKDESGRTLVSQGVEMLTEESIKHLRILLEVKKADCNIADINGFNPLHHLCSKGRPVCEDVGLPEGEKFEWEEKTWSLQKEACELIIKSGCNVNATSSEGMTPLMHAFRKKNIKLVEVLMKYSDLNVVSFKVGSVFHCMETFDEQMLRVCQDLLKNFKFDKMSLNILNEDGFTPFLKLVHYFTSNFPLHKEQVRANTLKIMESELKNQKFSKNRKKDLVSSDDDEDDNPNMELQILAESDMNLCVDHSELVKRIDLQVEQEVKHFINLLKLMHKSGADTKLTVGKLKKYRDNPGLIESEIGLKSVFYQNSIQKKNYILDYDGTKRFKEYSENGLQNVVHLSASCEFESIINYLLSLDLDLNQRDFYGDTPIMVFIKYKSKFSKNLVAKNIDVNIRSCDNDLPLHKAIQNNSLDLVSLLINSNSQINTLVSPTGTTPLIASILSKNILIIEKLLNSEADPNFPDSKLRTPLHIAFNLSNSSSDASFDIESLLILYKANINAIDVRGRSPLHYSFVKIGKHLDESQIDPIESVSSACSLSNIDVNIQDNWKRTPLHYAALRGALTSTMFLLNKKALLDIEDYQGNSPLALAIKGGHANYAVMLVQNSANVHKKVNIVPVPKEKPEEETRDLVLTSKKAKALPRNLLSYEEVKKSPFKDGVYSLFQAAIIQEWQGLAYLLLFNGYPYMLAMQDSMSQNKFQLVKTLLAKVSDNSILKEVNTEGQNLVHTLAIFGANADFNITKAICDQLIQRGVGLSITDVYGRSPLHYAAKSGYKGLIKVLLSAGVSLRVKDRDGNCPVAYAIEGKKVCNSLEILLLFKEYTAQFNFYLDDNGIKLTPLLHSINQRSPAEVIQFFLNNGCSVKEKDSQGRSALIYSIIHNDLGLFKALMSNKDIEIEALDKSNRSALHYVINPLKYGSYENTEMLTILLNTKKLNPVLQDSNNNETPFSLALKQRSTRMLRILQSYGISGLIPSARKLSLYEPPNVIFDFRSDSLNYIEQQKDVVKVTDVEKTPDPSGEFPQHFKVVQDYDVLMTKVDVSKGPYSAYTFYRMQMLHDTNRNVFVLFTRWGRIGEIGAYQRTPFSEYDEGIKEFCKIFKAKSGNEWADEFVKKKGKYVIMKMATTETRFKDFIQDFDEDRIASSKLSLEVEGAIKSCSSQTMFRTCFGYYSVDVNVLNFSNLSKEGIDEAEGYLLKISERIKFLSTEAEVEKKLKLVEEIQELSSRYYELIPIIHDKNSAVAPIIDQNTLKVNIEKIALLRNLELASKLILGALFKQYAINPYDYIANCLSTNINVLEKNSAEYELIIKYMQQTSDNNKVLSIFRVNRKGEAEAIEKFKDEHSRKLLWHGTSTANIIGILMQGLKIAPPEVPNTGYMFGKGVYFADCFCKSYGYSSGFMYNNDSCFLLLCEVVLGKMLEKKNAEFIEKLPKKYLSTLGLGSSRPDPRGSIFTPFGAEVPVGELIKVNDPELRLAYNEYIVYNTSQVRIRYMVHLKSNL